MRVNENMGLLGFVVDGLDDAVIARGVDLGIFSSSGFGFMLGTFGFAMEAGDRVYQRNQKHRAKINFYNCLRLDSAMSSQQDGRFSAAGILTCDAIRDKELE